MYKTQQQDPALGTSLYNLALCYVHLGKKEQAVELLRAALLIYETRVGKTNPLYMQCQAILNSLLPDSRES